MKLWKALLPVLVALATIVVYAPKTTAQTSTPTVADRRLVTGFANELKWPMVKAGAGRVHIAWAAQGAPVNYASRDELSNTDFAVEALGQAGRQTTFQTAAVAVAGDGTVHYAWIANESSIYHRSKALGQAWSGVHLIATGENFANRLDLAVKGTNEVFAAWRTSAGGPRFAYSPNAGQSFPIVGDVPLLGGNQSYGSRPRLGVGSNGSVFLSWETKVAFDIAIGEWNGQTFVTSCVTCGLGGDYFDPSVSVGPDGTPYVAFRRTNVGVYYGYRTNGTWVFPGQSGSTPLFRGAPGGPVIIRVDSQNNVHLSWIDANTKTAYYAAKKADDVFSNVIPVSDVGGRSKFNIDMDVSVKPGLTAAHIVWEEFAAGGNAIGYARVHTSGIGCLAGAAAVEPQETNQIGNFRLYLPMVMNQKAPTC